MANYYPFQSLSSSAIILIRLMDESHNILEVIHKVLLFFH